MRIAVVCTDTGVRIPDEKGASLHLSAIVGAFRDLGHATLLVGVAGHGLPRVEGPVLLLSHPGRSEGEERERRKLALVERAVTRSSDVVTRFAPDIVYERLSLFGTAGARLARRTGALHVVEVNSLLSEEEARWRTLHHADLARERERAVLGAAHLRVAVSETIAAAVEEAAPGPPTVVVPNGVDGSLFTRQPLRAVARRLLDLPASDPLIAFTGTLRPWHGIHLAIAALAHLPAPVRLVIAGDGELRADLQILADRFGVGGRVHWLGHVPHVRIPALLAACDVAVAPYPEPEGPFPFSPLKVFEYLAAGIPVVASDVGQLRHLLDDGTLGTLVPAGDVPALAAAIEHALTDPGARAIAEIARWVCLGTQTWRDRAATILRAVSDLREPRALAP